MKSSLIATRLEYIYRAEGRAEHRRSVRREEDIHGRHSSKTQTEADCNTLKHTHVHACTHADTHTHEDISHRKEEMCLYHRDRT